MLNTKINEEGGSIILTLAAPNKRSGPVDLTDNDVKKFSGVHPLYVALRHVFGDRLSAAVLEGAVLRMDVQPDDHDGISYGLQSFVDDIEATAKDLHKNSARNPPLPFAQAVKRPILVGVVQAVSRAHHAFGLDVVAVSTGEPRKFPTAKPADFTQPDQDRELRRTGSFQVKGLVRDDVRGHQLLVSENELRVLLPLSNPIWAWHEIRHVLDDTAWLIGTLVRESKTHTWTTDTSSRLEIQTAMTLA